MTEAQIQKEIVVFMKTLGFACWETSQGYRKERGGTRMTPGIPDLYFIGHGLGLWCEVKRPKGKLTEAQELFQQECWDNGILHQVWRDVRDAFDWMVRQGFIEEGVQL